MILNLCNTTDGVNVINKTYTLIQSVDVKLRKDFNIVDPTFLISIENAHNYKNVNYVVLNDLGKFYNVNSVEIINSKLIKIVCSIDVLETYKTNIINSEFNYYRSIKTGDYFNGELPETTLTTITKVESDYTFNSGTSQILVTVGGYN